MKNQKYIFLVVVVVVVVVVYYIPVAILIDEVLAWNKQIDVCTKLARANEMVYF